MDDILGLGICFFTHTACFVRDSVEVRCRKCDEAQAGKSLHRFS